MDLRVRMSQPAPKEKKILLGVDRIAGGDRGAEAFVLYLDVLPAWVVVESVVDIVVKALRQTIHKRSSGCDTVGVKMLFWGLFWRQVESFGVQFTPQPSYCIGFLGRFLRCSKPVFGEK